MNYVTQDGGYEEVSVHIPSRIVLSVAGKKIGGGSNSN